MENFKYFGCFFNQEKLIVNFTSFVRQPLSRIIKIPHITMRYRPDSVPLALFGQTITIRVVGYGNNKENEALLVEFVDYPKEMQPYIQDIAVPHITLSVSRTGRSVNSSNLEFSPIVPFCLIGTIGAMTENGTVCLVRGE